MPSPIVEEPITLSALEFDVLWEYLGLGHPPLVISVPSPGRTHTERADIQRQVFADLRYRRLAGPSDPIPTVEQAFRLMANPEREVDARIWVGRRVRALGVARRDQALMAVLDRDELTLYPASAAALPAEAANLPQPLPAGPGRSVTLPSSDLEAAAQEANDSLESLEFALRRRGIRLTDADMLASMLTDVSDRGQFGAAVRNRWGKRLRSEHVVGYFDTPAGRYLQIRRESESGEPWSTVAPADSARIATHIAEILKETEDMAHHW